jgi:hypothetical protein
MLFMSMVLIFAFALSSMIRERLLESHDGLLFGGTGLLTLIFTLQPRDRRTISMFAKSIIEIRPTMQSMHIGLCLFFLAFSGLAAAQLPIDAGQTTANVFESPYFHFRYELPKGWFSLEFVSQKTRSSMRPS